MKKILSKEQQEALKRVMNQSFKYQKERDAETEARTINNMMKWNKENLSPNGGKKAWNKTQKETMTPKRKGQWFTKDEE